MKNLQLYGYGAKGMMLSMIEVICRITKGKANLHCVDSIIKSGQELLQRPVTLLPDVEEVIQTLSTKYRLILATKGDLSEQKRKILSSGLRKYFYHIEIMDNKDIAGYQIIFDKLNCSAEHILMVGNSIKSDILPVIELGGYAIQIPFRLTWLHEQYPENIVHDKYIQLDHIKQILNYLV
jgi:putative hydrolase of the HAD superfamily